MEDKKSKFLILILRLFGVISLFLCIVFAFYAPPLRKPNFDIVSAIFFILALLFVYHKRIGYWLKSILIKKITIKNLLEVELDVLQIVSEDSSRNKDESNDGLKTLLYETFEKIEVVLELLVIENIDPIRKVDTKIRKPEIWAAILFENEILFRDQLITYLSLQRLRLKILKDSIGKKGLSIDDKSLLIKGIGILTDLYYELLEKTKKV